MRRIAIVTNVIPSYRQEFYDAITRHYGRQLTIYCQQHIPGVNLDTVEYRYRQCIETIDSWVAPKERIGWQFLPLHELLKFQIIFFYGNPRLISSVIWSLYLKWHKRKVVIWGQAHSAEAHPFLEALRLNWWRCFNFFFVYTDKEKKWLVNKGFKHCSIVAMNNGLNQCAIDQARKYWPKERISVWKCEQNIKSRFILLSCARLIEKNRFQQAIYMLKELNTRNCHPLWVVIGDGPERERLEKLASKLKIDQQIIWVGKMYEEAKLAPWFLSADLFIHPAAIGLSLLHAMGYGLPVVTHNNAHAHMPEFAAFVEGQTGLGFKQDNISDFAEKTETLLYNNSLRQEMATKALHIARTQFNTDVMISRFIEMVERASKEPEDHS